MERRHFQLPIALAVTLLTICPLAIVAAISAWTFTSTVNSIIHQNVTQLSATAVEKLGEQIGKLMAPFKEKVESMSKMAIINHVPQFLTPVTKALKENEIEGFSIYYATEISRLEEGESLCIATIGFPLRTGNHKPALGTRRLEFPLVKFALVNRTSIPEQEGCA